jgi:PAS domain S-box-containing protein
MTPRETRVWRWPLAGGAALAVLSLALPRAAEIHAVLLFVFGAMSAAAIVAGLALHRPRNRLPWQLLAAGMALYALASAAWEPSRVGWIETPSALGVELVYFLAYSMILAALASFVPARWTNVTADIDALLIVSGLAALVWLVVVDPRLDQSALSMVARVAAIGYPALDLLMLATALRMAFVLRPSPMIALLIGFVLLRLAGDIGFGAASLAGSFRLGGGASALWLLSSAFLAAAALHPSMSATQEPTPAKGAARERRRLPVTVAFGPLPLAILLVLSRQSRLHQVLVFVVVAWATYLLVVARVLLLRRDIAEQRTRAEALAAASERWRTMVEQIPGVIYTTPVESSEQTTYMSPQIRDVIGYPREAWEEPGFWESIVDPADLDRVIEEDRRTGEIGEPFRVEYRMRAADGRTVWAHDEAALVRAPDGTPLFWLGNVFDISREKEAEQKLAAAEELYRSLVEAAPGVTYRDVVDGGGPAGHRTEYVSPQVLELLGYPPEAFVEDPALWSSLVHPEDRERAVRADLRHYATGEPLSLDIRMLTRDGRVRWVQDRALIVRRGGDLVSHGTLFDVTQSKELDAAIRAREAAEEASRAKTEFLSRASHELRTPLNAILGFGQLLEQASLAPEDHESAEEVVRAGRRLLAIVDDVLGIAGLEAGRVSMSIEPVRLDEVAAEAALAVEAATSGSDVVLQIAGEPDAGRHVMADRESLRKALVHLMRNAVQYNRPGGRAIVSWRAIPTDCVEILVEDEGPGIPPERLEHLFSPFERLGAERSQARGTGLGLALTKRLVEGMGGTVAVAARDGGGTCLSVRLLEANPVGPGSPEGDAREAEGPSEGMRTVLYIEDNPSNVVLIERALARLPGVRLLTAGTGALGVDLVRRHRPDLVLLDLNLPDVEGEEVLRSILADPSTSDAAVVVVSADRTASKAARLVEAGARDYLVKPIDLTRLLRLVDDVLAAGRGAHHGA